MAISNSTAALCIELTIRATESEMVPSQSKITSFMVFEAVVFTAWPEPFQGQPAEALPLRPNRRREDV